MKAFSIALMVVAAGCTAGPAAARAKAGAPASASIVDSGSVNTAPFTVVVDALGKAQAGGKRRVSVPSTVSAKFFSDIREAQIHSRPSGAAMCFKTPSGSVLRVHTGSWRSVDLHCPVIGANAALKADVDAILQTVNPARARRISLPPNEPRRVEPTMRP